MTKAQTNHCSAITFFSVGVGFSKCLSGANLRPSHALYCHSDATVIIPYSFFFFCLFDVFATVIGQIKFHIPATTDEIKKGGTRIEAQATLHFRTSTNETCVLYGRLAVIDSS